MSLLLCGVIFFFWELLSWGMLNLWYSCPMFGPIARAKSVEDDKKLCDAYKVHYRLCSKYDYEEKIRYLSKARDTGRSDTPKLIWILTVCLVLVEAQGFSYVLAGYTIPGASENIQKIGGLAISLVVAVLLVGFTHSAGHEWYVSEKVKKARRAREDEGCQYPMFSRDVPLSTDQSVDDHEKWYTQFGNRIEYYEPRIKIRVLTCFLVLAVAIGATYVRGKVMEKQLHEEVSGHTFSLQLGEAATLSLNLDGLVLPDADQAQADIAREKVIQDGKHLDEQAGWGTFIVLAVIFVFLQLLGILFGYRWGFAGKESKKAFKAIGGNRFSNYEAMRHHYRKVADVAQAKLETLRKRRKSQDATDGMSGRKEQVELTFFEYLAQEREKETLDLENQVRHEQQRRVIAGMRAAQDISTTYAGEGDGPSDRPLQESSAEKIERLEREMEEARRQAHIEAMEKKIASLKAGGSTP